MLANNRCTPIPLKRARYWLDHSSAQYVYCNAALINPDAAISTQPIEHLESNLYTICTDFYRNLDNLWCGLFRKKQLEYYLKGTRSIKRLEKNIHTKLYKKNRALVCAV